jgi:hypothetical protein
MGYFVCVVYPRAPPACDAAPPWGWAGGSVGSEGPAPPASVDSVPGMGQRSVTHRKH